MLFNKDDLIKKFTQKNHTIQLQLSNLLWQKTKMRQMKCF